MLAVAALVRLLERRQARVVGQVVLVARLGGRAVRQVALLHEVIDVLAQGSPVAAGLVAQTFWVGAKRPVLGLSDAFSVPSEEASYTNNIGSQGIRLAAEINGIREGSLNHREIGIRRIASSTDTRRRRTAGGTCWQVICSRIGPIG